MTTSNDTREDVYSQIMRVDKHMSALKDVYENMPDTDRYFSVISLIGEGLESELKSLYSLSLGGATNE
jgi:hypothetical protein